MHVGMVLEMASDGMGDRIALGSAGDGISFADLGHRSRRAATVLADAHGDRVVLVDENSPALPLALYGAAIAGKPFAPVNYRLADDKLRAIVTRTAPATVIVGEGVADRLEGIADIECVTREDFLAATTDGAVAEMDGWGCDPDATAVLLFTSGTTGEPKAAVLRNRNLAAYLVESVEFGASAEDDAAIVSVPPYHIAAVSSVLSTTYSGRRVVQLERFDPQVWVDTVRAERITHAMVVPTMLNRILDVIDADGARSAVAAIAGLRRRPHAPARGRTRARSPARSGPGERLRADRDGQHDRRARSRRPSRRLRRRRSGASGSDSARSAVRCRVSRSRSATRTASRCPTASAGRIWVRGDQVSGEYEGRDSTLQDGWFDTRDAGRVDDDGYLYVEGRLDDVIVRGGENLSPGEIESAADRPSGRGRGGGRRGARRRLG